MEPNVKVLKSFLPAPAGLGQLWRPYGATVDGAIAWPRDPYALLTFYTASAEHARAIHVRASAAFGNGVTGDQAERLEALCPTGAADLFMSLAIDYGAFGNAFLYAGPLGLERRPALTMSRHASGGYIQTLYDPQGNHQTVFYKEAEIIHIKAPCPAGHWYSLPEWAGGWGMLELIQAATDYNREFFRNHGLPQYAIVTYGAKLSPDEETAVQNFFSSTYKGPGNQHKTLYLHCDDPQHGKVEFQKLTDTKDGDFLKLLDAARDRIAIAHGVPPRLLGIVSAGSLGGGGEATAQIHIFEEVVNKPMRTRFMGALRPLLQRLGLDWRALNFAGMDLTPPEGDRANSDHLTEWLTAGLIDLDEARAMLQLPTRPAPARKSADRSAPLTASREPLQGLLAALERL